MHYGQYSYMYLFVMALVHRTINFVVYVPAVTFPSTDFSKTSPVMQIKYMNKNNEDPVDRW